MSKLVIVVTPESKERVANELAPYISKNYFARKVTVNGNVYDLPTPIRTGSFESRKADATQKAIQFLDGILGVSMETSTSETEAPSTVNETPCGGVQCGCGNEHTEQEKEYLALVAVMSQKAPYFCKDVARSVFENNGELDRSELYKKIKEHFTPDEIAYLAVRDIINSVEKAIEQTIPAELREFLEFLGGL